MAASGFDSEDIKVQSCCPLQATPEVLLKESLKGCIWTVSKPNLRKVMWHASECGIAVYGIRPTGWAEQAQKEFMPGCEETDDICVAASDDGVFSFLYSDHCSFLELVQFLQFLPAVPVTFLSPVMQTEGSYTYNGAQGVQELLDDTGVPSIRYYNRWGALEKIGKSKRKLSSPELS